MKRAPSRRYRASVAGSSPSSCEGVCARSFLSQYQHGFVWSRFADVTEGLEFSLFSFIYWSILFFPSGTLECCNPLKIFLQANINLPINKARLVIWTKIKWTASYLGHIYGLKSKCPYVQHPSIYSGINSGVCTYEAVVSCVAYTEARGRHKHIFLKLTFWDRVSHGTWRKVSRVGWAASDAIGSSCLVALQLEVRHEVQLFIWVLGISTLVFVLV